MNIKIIIATAVVGFVGVPQTGCLVVAAVGAGAGAVMYTKGDLEVTSTKSFDEVYAVVEETCKELNFEIQKNEKKAFAGRITARSDFGNVTFDVKSESTELTSLSIRVGVFGDRDASNLIYAKLKPKL
jgi:Cdc6-like AAA superfamily ATPase